MGKKLARPTYTTLNFIENEQEVVFVTKSTNFAKELTGEGTDTAFTLHRLDQDRSRLVANCCFECCHIVVRNLIKTSSLWAKPFQILCLPTGSDGCQRAPVESTFKCDDMEFLRMALGILIAARSLDCTFQGLGTRIREEYLVCECCLGQSAA